MSVVVEVGSEDDDNDDCNAELGRIDDCEVGGVVMLLEAALVVADGATEDEEVEEVFSVVRVTFVKLTEY